MLGGVWGVPTALLLAGGLLLAGCAGDSVATATDSPGSPSPSLSASASPGPTVSVPEAARAQTQEGGIEFAKFYATLLSDSVAVPDSTALQALSVPDCAGCQTIINDVDEYVRGGFRLVDPRAQLIGAQASSPYDAAQFSVDVLGKQVAGTVIDANGQVAKELDEVRLHLRITVLWTEAGWRALDVRALNP